MERIGIYGGSFNPPHIGHIQAAKQAVEVLNLDKLLVIPAGIAPHKDMPDNTPTPRHRLDMLRLTLADCPEIEVSDLEVNREGPSYTWETIQHLKEMYPEACLILFMGTDMFLSIDSWKNSEFILENATLGVFYRGNKGEAQAIEAKKAELEAQGAKVELVQNVVIPISSTQMRRLLAFRCAGAFLPEGVLDYIREHRLYDTRADWKNLPMDKLEQVVISLLKPNRVAHVLGCRDTAVELAKRWGADVTDAARAGILHDITKAIDGPLQLTLCEAYGKILSDFSRRYPKTLHALTGSLVAKRIFGENDAVVSAIEHHTTGKADMNLLEKIIYVADYMEPNRDFPGVEKLRELAFTDIDAALKLGLEMTLEHLKRQGAEVSPASRDALAWFDKQ
ncbi:MAG: nicotinate (nicotinamide) nucleotide adenylyltransferase [Oscillospiraceae bacterium]|nr:nicotinate (nicotinamide) nucleotide adenylyltransferase [Oscillospiraceae bacterium]